MNAVPIFKRVRELPVALWVAFRWVAALDMASQRKPVETLKIIDALPERFQQLLSWQLLRLQQYSVTGNAFAARDLARTLIPRIANSRLSENVKSYLSGYAKWLVGKAIPADEEFQVNWSDVRLDVPEFWKRRFPLRGHPAWTA